MQPPDLLAYNTDKSPYKDHRRKPNVCVNEKPERVNEKPIHLNHQSNTVYVDGPKPIKTQTNGPPQIHTSNPKITSYINPLHTLSYKNPNPSCQAPHSNRSISPISAAAAAAAAAEQS